MVNDAQQNSNQVKIKRIGKVCCYFLFLWAKNSTVCKLLQSDKVSEVHQASTV